MIGRAGYCNRRPQFKRPDAARTVKRHWDGILRWFHSRIANGLIEGHQ
jgi:transposase